MAKRRTRDNQRFRIYEDDRSGLEFGFQPITSPPNAYYRESGKPVLDKGLRVSPSSYDMPPPSDKPIGGEGDMGGDYRSDSDPATPSNVYVIPTESVKNILYVNSSAAIQWNNDPTVYISGSNAAQIMAVNPQFIAGQQNQVIAVECVGSSVTLINGSGLTFDFQQSSVNMGSGSVVTMFYNATDSTWHLTSFNAAGGL